MYNVREVRRVLVEGLQFSDKLAKYYANCKKEIELGLIPEEGRTIHEILTELLRIILDGDSERLDDFLQGQENVFKLLGVSEPEEVQEAVSDATIRHELGGAFEQMKEEARIKVKGF